MAANRNEQHIIGELGNRLGTKTEEKFLHIVSTMLHRIYRGNYGPRQPINASMRAELTNVMNTCADSLKHRDQELGRRIAADFANDPAAPAQTNAEMIQLLRLWKARMLLRLEYLLGRELHAEDDLRHIGELDLSEVEMPGQYQGGHIIDPRTKVFIASIARDIRIVRRAGAIQKRLGFIGTDGVQRYFCCMIGVVYFPGPDERVLQVGEGRWGCSSACAVLRRAPSRREGAVGVTHGGWHVPARAADLAAL